MLKRGSKDWDRFWSKVNKVNKGPNCWEWTGCKSGGYGKFWLIGRKQWAHRVVMTMRIGTIPKGMYVCHICDNKGCVRPSHLVLGTPKDNIQDSINKGRSQRGETNGHSKLTEKQIREIRNDHRIHIIIAKEYNVGRRAIDRIIDRTRWKHLT